MALAGAAAENASLNGIFGTGSSNTAPYLSLHTATTSTTGASENANTGSYARQSITWATASAGSAASSNSQMFSTAGSVPVTYVGTWSVVTYAGGTFSIGAALGASVTAASITTASGAVTFTSS